MSRRERGVDCAPSASSTPARPTRMPARIAAQGLFTWRRLARASTLLVGFATGVLTEPAWCSATRAQEPNAPGVAAHDPSAVDEKAARDGFRHVDRGFEGQFEDALAHKLVLAADGNVVRGTLSYLVDWSITAESRGRRLVGRARNELLDQPFEATWEEDRLVVTVGRDPRVELARTYAEDPAVADLGPVQVDPERRWTLAVYLGGDNDLEYGALLDLEELRTSMPATGVEVIVLLDRARGHFDEPEGWTDAHVFRLRAGAEGAPILKPLGEIDTADGRTLASFLAGAFRTFPSEHQAAIVWDHGGGYGGIVVDEEIPGAPAGRVDMLDLGEVRAALRTAAWHSGRSRIDLLAFDACLMAQLEVALAVREHARFLVASETLVPGLGYPYDAILPLFVDTTRAPRDVAIGMVEAFAASYEREHVPGTTLSAIDLGEVGSVAHALDRFAARLEPDVKQNWPAIVRALYFAEAYEPRTERESRRVRGSRDLVDVVRRIARGITPFPAATEVGELDAVLSRAVIASRVGDGRRSSHGLALYAPYRADQWDRGHDATPLGGSNRFQSLLHAAHALAVEGARDPVTFSNVAVRGHEASREPSLRILPTVRPFDGDRIEFTLSGNSIVAVEQWDCVRDGEGYAVLRKNWVPDPTWMLRVKEGFTDEADLFMPVFADGRNELWIELFGMQYRVTNDETMVNATLDVTAPSIDAPIVARARFTPAGGGTPVDVEVRFDRVLWHAAEVLEIGAADALGAPRTIQPAPEDTFAFLIEAHGDDGTVDLVAGTPIPWRKGFGLVLTADEPGRYRSVLNARTMDGRVTSARVDYRVEENPDLTAWSASFRDFDPTRVPGLWKRQVAVAPGQWLDIDAPTRIHESPGFAPGIYDATTAFGPTDARETMGQLWILDTRGVPNLRIVSSLEGDRKLGWYGPASLGRDGISPTITFKAVNIGGLLFRWKRDVIEDLKLPGEAPAEPHR